MPSSPPLVSVIIPVHNGERFLAEAIESALHQFYTPVEVLVVDDGSADGSAQIALSYERILLLKQGHLGVAAARNQGLSHARGAFLSFLDADDIWTPEKVSLQVDCLFKNPDVDYVLGRYRNFFEPGKEIPSWVDRELILKDSAGFSPGTLLARRAVFEKAGLFNPLYQMGEDIDWFIRVRETPLKMKILPDILMYRRLHDRNLSYQARENRSHLLRIFKSSIERKKSTAVSVKAES